MIVRTKEAAAPDPQNSVIGLRRKQINLMIRTTWFKNPNGLSPRKRGGKKRGTCVRARASDGD